MIFTTLKGGLGNQMFQYAAGKALATARQTELQIDLSFLLANTQSSEGFVARAYELHLFPGIKERTTDIEKQWQPVLWRKLKHKLGLFQPNIYHETAYSFNKDFFKVAIPVVLDGYWQSEKYFHSIESLIRKAFVFPEFAANDRNLEVMKLIYANNAVSVHVRRTDYLQKHASEFHGVCSADYYERAIQKITELVENPFFVFFSDDPGWVEANLAVYAGRFTVVKGNSGEASWKDMFLMSNCSHHIIANSSFSWWGAWLNASKHKIVIAPEKWFRTTDAFYNTGDLLPGSWLKL